MTEQHNLPPGSSPDYDALRDRAKRLVRISHLLGWGGIGLLFVGTILTLIVTRSATAAGVIAVSGIISAIVGAVVGQVGRAMQGRVI